jgi:hypothetical protein
MGVILNLKWVGSRFLGCLLASFIVTYSLHFLLKSYNISLSSFWSQRMVMSFWYFT